LSPGYRRDFVAAVVIPEWNFTLPDTQLAVNSSMNNNLTYSLYYSQYFGSNDNYTIKFQSVDFINFNNFCNPLRYVTTASTLGTKKLNQV